MCGLKKLIEIGRKVSIFVENRSIFVNVLEFNPYLKYNKICITICTVSFFYKLYNEIL